MIASLAVLGVAILILCLCDLPWERVIDQRQAKQLQKPTTRLSGLKALRFGKSKAKKREELDYANYNDEQMIRRFKSAIVNQRQGSQVSGAETVVEQTASKSILSILKRP